MADKKPTKWVTINGRHVPIYEDNFSDEKYMHINPNKGSKEQYDPYGYNCVKCALAFEANMRGEDTEANAFEFGNTDDVNKSRHPEKAFNGAEAWGVSYTTGPGKSPREKVVNNIIDTMKEDFGDGSRAIIVTHGKGNQHTFNVINEKGKVIFVDSQSGIHGEGFAGGVKVFKGIQNSTMVDIIRTDDVDMNEEYKKWAYKNRG